MRRARGEEAELRTAERGRVHLGPHLRLVRGGCVLVEVVDEPDVRELREAVQCGHRLHRLRRDLELRPGARHEAALTGCPTPLDVAGRQVADR